MRNLFIVVSVSTQLNHRILTQFHLETPASGALHCHRRYLTSATGCGRLCQSGHTDCEDLCSRSNSGNVTAFHKCYSRYAYRPGTRLDRFERHFYLARRVLYNGAVTDHPACRQALCSERPLLLFGAPTQDMDAPLYVPVALAASALSLWLIFKRYLIKSPLDNLPGPPPTSFLFGKYFSLLQGFACLFAHVRKLVRYQTPTELEAVGSYRQYIWACYEASGTPWGEFCFVSPYPPILAPI